MNKDVIEGRWKQFQGEIMVWMGSVTHNDLNYAAGKLRIFSGLLQERYGLPGSLSIEEIHKRVAKYKNNPTNKNRTISE